MLDEKSASAEEQIGGKRFNKDDITNLQDKPFQPIINYYGPTIQGSTISGDYIGSHATKNTSTNGSINISSVVKIRNREIIASCISKHQISFVESVFVEPENYQNLKNKLYTKNLILLYGEKETGKFTSAIKLLLDAGKNDLITLRPSEVDYNNMLEFEFKKETGYIFDYLIPYPFESLNANILKQLENILTENKSKLIIIIDKNLFNCTKSFFYDFSYELSSQLDKISLVNNHLIHYAREASENNLTDSEHVFERIDEILGIDSICNIIESSNITRNVEIAKIIIEGILDEQNTMQIVKNIENSISLGIEKYMDYYNDFQEWLFVVALAFFETTNYAIISKAFIDLSMKLYDLLPESNRKDINENRYLGLPKSKRLENIKQTTLYNKEHNSEIYECIRFINPRYSELIIEYIWKNYEFWHERILEWLFEFHFESDYYVQNRIAHILSIISKYNFELVKSFIIEHWVKTDSITDKISAAKTFNCCSEYEQNQLKIYKLLHEWAYFRGSQNYTIVVLYSYAGSLGSRFFDNALVDIRTITDTLKIYEDFKLEHALYNCISRMILYNYDNMPICKKLLDFFINLLSSGKYLSFFSKSMFLDLFMKSYSALDHKLYPSLLLIYGRHTELRTCIISLWIKSLSDNFTNRSSLDILKELLTYTESHRHIYDLTESLFLGLLQASDLYQIRALIEFLDSFSEEKTEGSNISTSILAKVVKLLK